MSAENKALARRFLEEVWNQHNLAVAEEIIDPNYVAHDPATPEDISGIYGFKQFFNLYTSAFPDQRFTILDLIAEGDRVVMRWQVEGTHAGALGEIPPTGKRIRITGTTISRTTFFSQLSPSREVPISVDAITAAALAPLNSEVPLRLIVDTPKYTVLSFLVCHPSLVAT
jgi:predicted ester cyclase